MSFQRAILVSLVVSLIAIGLLGGWLRRREAEIDHRPAPTTAQRPAIEVTEPTVTPAARTGMGRHRLAGTVVGDVQYAIIEHPNGGSDLYRPGQTVPGLGRVVDIDADGATFVGSAGRIRLHLAPAPTATVTAPPTHGSPGHVPTSPRRPEPAPSESESLPSGARGPRAS